MQACTTAAAIRRAHRQQCSVNTYPQRQHCDVQKKRLHRVPKGITGFCRRHILFVCFHLSCKGVTKHSSSACHFGTGTFDQTCGFPGEGPVSENMNFISCNVGSVHSNHDWKTWSTHVLCLQETRIGKNNKKSASYAFHDIGHQVSFGALLPGIIQNNGRTHTHTHTVWWYLGLWTPGTGS